MLLSKDFHLILKDSAALDPGFLVPLLAKLDGWTAPDSAMFVRKCGGFLGSFDKEEEARRFAGQLRDMGVDSALLHRDRMTPMPQPESEATTRAKGKKYTKTYRGRKGPASLGWVRDGTSWRSRL